MGSRRLAALVMLTIVMGPFAVPAFAEAPPDEWAFAMERRPLPDRVRLTVDGETALEGHLRFFGDRREASLEGDFRGRELRVRCRRNPLVHALNCFVRVDGEVRSNHVIVQ